MVAASRQLRGNSSHQRSGLNQCQMIALIDLFTSMYVLGEEDDSILMNLRKEGRLIFQFL